MRQAKEDLQRPQLNSEDNGVNTLKDKITEGINLELSLLRRYMYFDGKTKSSIVDILGVDNHLLDINGVLNNFADTLKGDIQWNLDNRFHWKGDDKQEMIGLLNLDDGNDGNDGNDENNEKDKNTLPDIHGLKQYAHKHKPGIFKLHRRKERRWYKDFIRYLNQNENKYDVAVLVRDFSSGKINEAELIVSLEGIIKKNTPKARFFNLWRPKLPDWVRQLSELTSNIEEQVIQYDENILEEGLKKDVISNTKLTKRLRELGEKLIAHNRRMNQGQATQVIEKKTLERALRNYGEREALASVAKIMDAIGHFNSGSQAKKQQAYEDFAREELKLDCLVLNKTCMGR